MGAAQAMEGGREEAHCLGHALVPTQRCHRLRGEGLRPEDSVGALCASMKDVEIAVFDTTYVDFRYL